MAACSEGGPDALPGGCPDQVELCRTAAKSRIPRLIERAVTTTALLSSVVPLVSVDSRRMHPLLTQASDKRGALARSIRYCCVFETG